ncbi:endonuclease/exonuclease/phosphatase family protein [Rhodococcus sp. 14C212]|uniref:endonuclease/exonuclease/phosphatase family protein n=1 Tax=Rhodococcus sp. 14C212 TaxID=2711209 RepID=UPI0013EB24B5|nr:endonuclease/exonuclease/phosphatase family protein [Rhodococcus sp. 14C212]NGP06962.1 endonuclease/exonuclease/phosphatase family protein [Rhodococcus sp. 14C212]
MSPVRPATVVAIAATVLGLTALVAFAADAESNAVIAWASLGPYLLLGTVAGAIAAALARRPVLLASTLVVVAAGAWTLGPLYVPGVRGDEPDAASGPTIRVMQANLMVGKADPDALVRTVRERQVDVLTVQELTGDAVAALQVAGLGDVLAHRFLAPTPTGGAGAGIYSRFPVSAGRKLDGFGPTNLTATLDTGPGRPLILYAVHPAPPYLTPAPAWAAELERLDAELESVAGTAPVVVSGDFNATYSHTRFRDLLDAGYVHAADRVGGGLVPTYPADRRYPALVGIDHILTRGATATSLDRIELPGSDHHGLVAGIRLPRPSGEEGSGEGG